MKLTNSNYRQFSHQEIIDSIRKGDFSLQTVNFDSMVLTGILSEQIKRNADLEDSHKLLFDEVKALRVSLNDLQKISGHPDPIPVNEADEKASNDHINKRFVDDNAQAEAEKKAQQEEAKRLSELAAEKLKIAAAARSKVAALLDEKDAAVKEKQDAINKARREAEQAEEEFKKLGVSLDLPQVNAPAEDKAVLTEQLKRAALLNNMLKK